jgi:hypothetical protein
MCVGIWDVCGDLGCVWGSGMCVGAKMRVGVWDACRGFEMRVGSGMRWGSEMHVGSLRCMWEVLDACGRRYLLAARAPDGS